MRRVAPNADGPARVVLARVGLLLTASFLLAGLTVVGLIGLGYHPLR